VSPTLPKPPIPIKAKPCPICGKPSDATFTPFCSSRCAQVDLNHWLSGVYAVPSDDGPANDEDGLE